MSRRPYRGADLLEPQSRAEKIIAQCHGKPRHKLGEIVRPIGLQVEAPIVNHLVTMAGGIITKTLTRGTVSVAETFRAHATEDSATFLPHNSMSPPVRWNAFLLPVFIALGNDGGAINKSGTMTALIELLDAASLVLSSAAWEASYVYTWDGGVGDFDQTLTCTDITIVNNAAPDFNFVRITLSQTGDNRGTCTAGLDYLYSDSTEFECLL